MLSSTSFKWSLSYFGLDICEYDLSKIYSIFSLEYKLLISSTLIPYAKPSAIKLPVEVPLIMAVKMTGSVSAVKAGVEAGARAAESVSGVINTHVIARPTDDAMKMSKRTSTGKDIVGKIKNNA